MGRVEQPDVEEKMYTLLLFLQVGISHACIELLKTSLKGVNAYYPSCLNDDDSLPCRLALEGEHSREQLEGILQRSDFEYKVVRGKTNTPYRLW